MSRVECALLVDPADLARDARIAEIERQIATLTDLLNRLADAQGLLAQAMLFAGAQRRRGEATQ